MLVRTSTAKLKSHVRLSSLFLIPVNLASISAGLGYGWPSPALVKLTNGTAGFAHPITEEDGSWLVSLPGLVSIFRKCSIFSRISYQRRLDERALVQRWRFRTALCLAQRCPSRHASPVACPPGFSALQSSHFCSISEAKCAKILRGL